MANSHTLEVMQYRCSACGYTWVHSRVALVPPNHPTMVGGTSTSSEANFVSLYTWSGVSLHPGCIRCVPQRLPLNWQNDQLERSRVAKLRASQEVEAKARPQAQALAKLNPYKDMDLDDLIS